MFGTTIESFSRWMFGERVGERVGEETTIKAFWPPLFSERVYHWLHFFGFETTVGQHTQGRDLTPRKNALKELEKLDPNELMQSMRLFTTLPAEFFEKFLRIQCLGNDKHIKLPFMGCDKKFSVRHYFRKYGYFSSPDGALHPSKWDILGWKSQEEYEEWLAEPMLYAFSHCMHYCEAPRIFDADTERNKKSTGKFHFKALSGFEKKTNILSVTGFEFRGYTGTIEPEEVKKHSKIIMQQILKAAQLTETTDIVLIPFGMGVFLPEGTKAKAMVKASMFAGMSEALQEYTGTAINIHCCGDVNYFNNLSQGGQNDRINFEDKSGLDAYVLANEIQDAEGPAKSMLINAGDSDWMALLNPRRQPGQCVEVHGLYCTDGRNNSTSDEYFALVTALTYFAIQSLIKFLSEQLRAKIISSRDETSLDKNLASDVETFRGKSHFSKALQPGIPKPMHAQFKSFADKKLLSEAPLKYSFLFKCLGIATALGGILMLGVALAVLFKVNPLIIATSAVAAGALLVAGATSKMCFQYATKKGYEKKESGDVASNAINFES